MIKENIKLMEKFEDLTKVPSVYELSHSTEESVSNSVKDNDAEGILPSKDDEQAEVKSVDDTDADSDDEDNTDKESEDVVNVAKEDIENKESTEANAGTESTESETVKTPETDTSTETTADKPEVPVTKEAENTDDGNEDSTPNPEDVDSAESTESALKDKNPEITGVSEGTDKTVSITAPQVEPNEGITEETVDDGVEKNTPEATKEKESDESGSKLIATLAETVLKLTNKVDEFQDKIIELTEKNKLDIPEITDAPTKGDDKEDNSTDDELEAPKPKSVQSAPESPEEGHRPKTTPDTFSTEEQDNSEETDNESESEAKDEPTEEEKQASVSAALDSIEQTFPEIAKFLTDEERVNYARAIRHIRFGEGTPQDANIIQSTYDLALNRGENK